MEPYRSHVIVCTQQKPEGVPSCCSCGSWQLLRALERELDAQGLDSDVQVTTCGCLGLCDDAPIMITYPEGIWYHKVKEEDVPEIVASHLRSGVPVARLAWNDATAMKAQSMEHRDRYRAMVKARDRAGILPDDLNEMIRAFMPSRAVLTALELGVFTGIDGGTSAGHVAQTIHADPRATEMLLDALVSLQFLTKSDGQYFHTTRSLRFFTEGSPDNAAPALLHTAHLWHRWSTLTDCVRTGTSVSERNNDSRWLKAFIAAMDRNASERAAAVVKAIATGPMQRMLDLGGGSGAYSIALARAIPGLRCDILDTECVLPLTREYVQKAGQADRIATRAGDMLHDPLGENYDLILASAICHMFSPEQNRDLCRRAYRALAPKGRFAVQDFVLEQGKTAPRAAALFSLNMLVGTEAGASYSEPEYAEWMKDAGLVDVHRVRLPGPIGLMIGSRP